MAARRVSSPHRWPPRLSAAAHASGGWTDQPQAAQARGGLDRNGAHASAAAASAAARGGSWAARQWRRGHRRTGTWRVSEPTRCHRQSSRRVGWLCWGATGGQRRQRRVACLPQVGVQGAACGGPPWLSSCLDWCSRDLGAMAHMALPAWYRIGACPSLQVQESCSKILAAHTLPPGLCPLSAASTSASLAQRRRQLGPMTVQRCWPAAFSPPPTLPSPTCLRRASPPARPRWRHLGSSIAAW